MNATDAVHDAEAKLEADLLAAWSRKGAPQAWILAGPKGLGKGVFAERVLSRFLGSKDGSTHRDLMILRPQEAEAEAGKPAKGPGSIGVDALRAFFAPLHLTTANGERRAVLVDPADLLTPQAANAFLKTLEEPPEGTVLVLTADSLAKLPETVRSRCAIERFPWPDAKTAKARVMASCKASEAEAEELCVLAEGNPGAAEALFQAGARVLYSKIVAALSRKAPFERSGLLELSQALGAAWPVGGDLVCRFIHRWAERAADPGAFVPVDPAEKVLLDRLAEEGGLSGASTAWEIARRMRAETDAERLDARYAPYRLLLAVEHGVKAAKKAKGAAA